MQLSELRDELSSRGFDYVSTTRLNLWLNHAVTEICETAPWPFLRATTTGVAPLEITDVRQVLSVTDTTLSYPLAYRPRNEIARLDAGVSNPGSPTYWWLDGDTIQVWPVNTTDSLSVEYVQVPTVLSADSDTPVIPSRWHMMIVDGAAVRAYIDSDNMDAATALQQFYATQLDAMVKTLLVPNLDGPRKIIRTGPATY